jgi:site-specific DNA-cytosine methylase
VNWRTLLAVDSDRWACEVYRANFPGVRVECGPVADFIDRLPDSDVILGGPPCQPFSDAGENEGERDERDCIPDFIRAIEKKKPRQFLMENVRGLLKEKHWPYFCRVIDQLDALGYAVQWKLLDAVSFGVPQFRERVWVWGIRSDLALSGVRHCWAQPTHAWPPPEPCMFGAALLPGITVRQALEIAIGSASRIPGARGWNGQRIIAADEPSPSIGAVGHNPEFIRVRQPRGPSWRSTEIARPIDEPSPSVTAGSRSGGGETLLIEMETGSKCRRDGDGHPRRPLVKSIDNPAFTIDGRPPDIRSTVDDPVPWHWSDALLDKQPPIELDRPSPAVVKNWHKGTPYRCLKWKQTKDGLWIRRLHPLECARLQSAPDSFIWPNDLPKTHAYRVIGNGWATRMGAVFAEALKSADPHSETLIDLFCGGGLGAVGWHGRFWQYATSESEVAS